MMHPAFELKVSKAGTHYFVIKARNNKILATSEMYKTKQAAENGINSVCENLYQDPDLENVVSIPSRSSIGIRLSTLKRMGIQTMADVGQALKDGKLKIDE